MTKIPVPAKAVKLQKKKKRIIKTELKLRINVKSNNTSPLNRTFL